MDLIKLWRALLLLCVAIVSSVATDDLRYASQRNRDVCKILRWIVNLIFGFFFQNVVIDLTCLCYFGWLQWPGHGGPGVTNHREAFRERKIDPKTVRAFEKKWEYTTGADVTATPAVSEGVVYFPSYNGNLHAVSAQTGEPVWEKNLTLLTAGIPAVVGKDFVASLFNLTLYSRSTPVVVGGLLLIGLSSPAVVIAVKKSSGALVWSSLLDAHPYAIVTMSGTAFEGYALYPTFLPKTSSHKRGR